MSVFTLKIIACVTMLIDHIGLILFPQNLAFRVLGRLAMPIFSYLIVNGVKHTRDVKKYLIRLSIFAIISQIPFSVMVSGKLFSLNLNVFFTEAIGILAILCYEKVKDRPLVFAVLPCMAISLLAEFIKTDYGMYGVLMMLLFYIARDNKLLMILYQVALNVVYLTLTNGTSDIQYFSLFALIFICFYNGKEGIKLKYLFYVFYSLHIGLLLLIKQTLI